MDIKAMLESVKDKPDWINSQALIALFQKRVNSEEYASRIYLAMSNWANINGWNGTAVFMKKQSHEETEHSEEFAQYLLDLNIQPIVDVLPKPTKQNYNSLIEMYQEVLKQELQVTKEINEIAIQALKDNDHMAYQIAGKFMAEQRQEISSIRGIIDRLEIAGDDKAALLIVDKELS